MTEFLVGIPVVTSRYLEPWTMLFIDRNLVSGVKIFWLLAITDPIEALEKMVQWNIKRGLERFDRLQSLTSDPDRGTIVS
jgi:hypothetical protein